MSGQVNLDSLGTNFVGSTSSLIGKLIQAYMKSSVANYLLSGLTTHMQEITGQASAESTKKAAKHEAKATRLTAIGGMSAGVGGVLAGGGSAIMGALAGKSGELDNLRKYKSGVKDTIANPEDSNKLSTLASKQDKDLAGEKIQELLNSDDYSKREFKKDETAIKLAGPEEKKALSDHLDKLIEQKTAEQRGVGQHQHEWMAGVRGLGEIGDGIAKSQAAPQTNAAGVDKANASLDQTSLSMYQSGFSQASKAADKFAELASQISQLIVSIAEANVFSNN